MSNNQHSAIPLKVVLSIIATGIMSFCGVIVETAMNITFPTLMEEFQVPTSTVQWLTTGYLLMVAIIVPLSATLKKRFNLKTLFLFANLSFLFGLLIDSFAPNFGILLLGRVIQGLGTGVALPLMFNIILEQVSVEKRGTMMGVGTLITAVAPALGPTFGGIAVSSLGWRYIFVLLLPFILCSLAIGLKCIQQVQPTQRVSVDCLSIGFVVITFVGLIVGFSEFGTKDFLSLAVAGALFIGIIGLLLFIRRSMKIEQPLIDIKVLKSGTFGGHVFAFFVLQLSTLGMSFILPNYIQLVNGSSATVAGLVILPAALLGAIMSPISGKILDSFGARKPILTGACLILLSLIIFTFNISAMKII
ncbi:MFS family major facilitator transporter [Enterococcus hermanniensis]|uniref:MFS family major facilitator transporter n=1 Tax=Enterococcus hermanniensis TaxID=249189 RepID=A0A1L8TS36_9ENTE|nr:MFS family major facilitator transporter [Enterococcus hermanniensis]